MLRQRFFEACILRHILVEILPPQKNNVIVVRVQYLQMFDEFLGIPAEPLPDRTVKTSINAYAHMFS